MLNKYGIENLTKEKSDTLYFSTFKDYFMDGE